MISRFVGLRFRIRVDLRTRPFEMRPSESVYRPTAFSDDRPARLYSIRKWNCTRVARSFIHLPKPHRCPCVVLFFTLSISLSRLSSLSFPLCFPNFSLPFFLFFSFFFFYFPSLLHSQVHTCTSWYGPRWRVNTMPRRLKRRGISLASERMRFLSAI